MIRSIFKRLAIMLGAVALLAGLLPVAVALAATFPVDVGNNFYNPQNLANISAGDTITWTRSAGTHDVVSANIPAGATAFASPTLNATNTTFSQAFTVAGNYRYYCSIHSDAAAANAATQDTTQQVGQFTVVAGTAPAPTAAPAAPAAPAPTAAPGATVAPAAAAVPNAATEAPEGMPASAVIVLLGAALLLLTVGARAVRSSR